MNSDQCFCSLLLLAENSFENIPFLLSGNTVWQQISGFLKSLKIDQFLAFLMNFLSTQNVNVVMLNATFSVIFKHCVNAWKTLALS